MVNSKKQLRALISQEKKTQKKSDLKQWSETIFLSIEQLELFQQAQIVLLYHSLCDEVDTHMFINKWYQQKTIVLPVVVNDILELRHYNGPHELKKGAYGIEEPTGALFTEFNKINLAIIPGVAFDKEGNRLGRGKGYYDRLLRLIKAPKIGVCFPFQFISQIPHEPFDIPMDRVVYQ